VKSKFQGRSGIHNNSFCFSITDFLQKLLRESTASQQLKFMTVLNKKLNVYPEGKILTIEKAK
jgi:hypothetical protein